MENIKEIFEILLDSEKLIAYGGLTLLLFIIFAETGLFFGFIFPGDALLLTAGLLCSTENFDVNIYLLLFSATLVAVMGNITGYATGKYFGKRLFAKKDSLFFRQKHLELTRNYFLKYGGVALVIGRFLPILRTFAPIMAGVTEINFVKFNLYNILGATIWVWTLIPLGFLLGKQFPHLVNQVEFIFLFVAVVTSILFIIGYIKQKKSMKTTKTETKNPSFYLGND
ncbi:MAG TPA: DedA family protein [Bacteroidia bacterium]|nr:DedA family protein [Bacteroidia bacterium]